MFRTSGVENTKVCGKVIAYQLGATDAFSYHGRGANPTIDSNYVDGVSLTHGHAPRNHIWTFAAAFDEYIESDHIASVCECSYSLSNVGTNPPLFVGQDYFCDSGIFASNYFLDPLWDGAGCGSTSTCCSFNNPPWFHKELPSLTSDDIEMRVCCDQLRSDEDIAMSSVKIMSSEHVAYNFVSVTKLKSSYYVVQVATSGIFRCSKLYWMTYLNRAVASTTASPVLAGPLCQSGFGRTTFQLTNNKDCCLKSDLRSQIKPHTLHGWTT